MVLLSGPRIPSPRISTLLLASAIAIIGTLSCVDEEPHDVVSMRGTVVFVALEGGFHAIIGDDGSHWDPDNLPEAFAVDSVRVSFRGVVTSHPTFHMWGRTVELTDIKRAGGPPEVNLEPFRELARASDCADVYNRLFLIDRQLVFWDRASQCADAAYARVLYGRTVEHLICDAHDSIAGPQRGCHDAGRYSDMFDIMLQHLDAKDLGLGPGHTVEPVTF
jgi:hypothetical protein